MPRLRNISSETLKVGGWQVDQIGSNIPLDKFGAAQHQLHELAPGESVEIPAQITNHPIIENIIATGKFEILDATLVPGGEVEEDPGLVKGETKSLVLELSDADLDAAALSQSFGMGALPEGSVVLDAFAEVSSVFDGGGSSASDVKLGSAADDDAIAGAVDLFSATGLVGATLLAKSFPAGLDVVAKISSDANVDLLTAAGAKITILYVVL